MPRFILFALLTYAISIFGHEPAHAELKWSFADVSFNRLDWNRGTEDKSNKTDFNYLELEGGAQYSWGELYGFFDYENVGKTGSEVRSAAKGSISYYLFATKLGLYAHTYNFSAYQFAEQNRVLGLSYSFEGDGWFFKPFLGWHDVSQTYFSGSNGYMGGWVVAYNFQLMKQKFMLLDWHEYEFQRHANYAAGNGGQRTAHNGAASVWWISNQHLSVGIQWRYATDKLGTPGSLGAVISTIKYFF